jgi:hypothetical protein
MCGVNMALHIGGLAAVRLPGWQPTGWALFVGRRRPPGLRRRCVGTVAGRGGRGSRRSMVRVSASVTHEPEFPSWTRPAGAVGGAIDTGRELSPCRALSSCSGLPLVAADFEDRPAAFAFRDLEWVRWRVLYDDVGRPGRGATPLAGIRSIRYHVLGFSRADRSRDGITASDGRSPIRLPVPDTPPVLTATDSTSTTGTPSID